MSQRSEEIVNLIKGLSPPMMPVFTAVVKSVDKVQMTCEVEPAGQVEINNVRLKAAIDSVTDGIVEFPKVGSSVLCGVIGQDEDQCCVIRCSQVEKTVINGGQNGGLINIKTLIEQLNKTNEVIEAITGVLTREAPPIIEPGNGEPSALKKALKGALAQKSVGDFSEMEDTKVTH